MQLVYLFFFLMIRRPPRSPLFPYPPLFRSDPARIAALNGCIVALGRALTPVNYTATGEYDHDLALPAQPIPALQPLDRKSTRLNSSHANISYAVFCLKKKK